MGEVQEVWAEVLLTWATLKPKMKKELALDMQAARALPEAVYKLLEGSGAVERLFRAPGCCGGVVPRDEEAMAAEQKTVEQERQAEADADAAVARRLAARRSEAQLVPLERAVDDASLEA